jgi:metallo-beta-lactamase family protein
LGGQLLSGAGEIEIFNEPCKVYAEVDKIDGMSAHGDADDLFQFIKYQNAEKVKGIFLVHGERAVQKTFAEKLSLKGFERIECPSKMKYSTFRKSRRVKENALVNKMQIPETTLNSLHATG